MNKIDLQIEWAELISDAICDIEDNFVTTHDLLDILACNGLMLCPSEKALYTEQSIPTFAYFKVLKKLGMELGEPIFKEAEKSDGEN